MNPKDEQIKQAVQKSVDNLLSCLTQEDNIVPGVKKLYADWNRQAIYNFAFPYAKDMLQGSAKNFLKTWREEIIEDEGLGPCIFWQEYETYIIDEIYFEDKIPYDSLSDGTNETRGPFWDLLTSWAKDEKLIDEDQTIHDLINQILDGEDSNEG
jgi:hypothetical protein